MNDEDKREIIEIELELYPIVNHMKMIQKRKRTFWSETPLFNRSSKSLESGCTCTYAILELFRVFAHLKMIIRIG